MNEAFICDYVRTPIGRYGGALSKVRADDLAAIPLAEILARNPKIDPSLFEEIYMGCTNQAGEDNRNVARMALLLAGFPVSVAGVTINRLCGSGLEAVTAAARAVKSGEMELVIAGGIESMSRSPFVIPKSDSPFSRNCEIYDSTIGWRFINKKMHDKYGTESMPETAENVAIEHNISREDQDIFAANSQRKANLAQNNGRFAQEIIKVKIDLGRGKIQEVTQDEHPRADTNYESLSKLKPITNPNGTITAGNASGVNDGAAAMIIASKAMVEKLGLNPIARIIGGSVSGIEPKIMGFGPTPAIQKLLALKQVNLSEIGVIELNEAFAAQALAVTRALGIGDIDERVNPNGGAIALGHPLGMSGARIVGTAALEIKNNGQKYALSSMCVGVGQGAALLLERI